MEKNITNSRSYEDIPLEINAEKTKWAIGICLFLITKLMGKNYKQIVSKSFMNVSKLLWIRH
jgi:hypothetical protein